MSYKKFSTINIPAKRWIKLGQYLFERMLEQFWTDEEINSYLSSGEFPGRDSYIQRVVLCEDWIISVAEYRKFLDWVISGLPKRFNEDKAKWMLQMIDLHMWPKTIELASQIKENTVEWDSK